MASVVGFTKWLAYSFFVVGTYLLALVAISALFWMPPLAFGLGVVLFPAFVVIEEIG